MLGGATPNYKTPTMWSHKISRVEQFKVESLKFIQCLDWYIDECMGINNQHQ